MRKKNSAEALISDENHNPDDSFERNATEKARPVRFQTCLSWLYVYMCCNGAPFLNMMHEAAGPGVCAAPVFENQVNKSIVVTIQARDPQDNIRQACAVSLILQHDRCHSDDVDTGEIKTTDTTYPLYISPLDQCLLFDFTKFSSPYLRSFIVIVCISVSLSCCTVDSQHASSGYWGQIEPDVKSLTHSAVGTHACVAMSQVKHHLPDCCRPSSDASVCILHIVFHTVFRKGRGTGARHHHKNENEHSTY